MCYTSAIRTCWPFGVVGITHTIVILISLQFVITMAYGVCTKTSRNLYDHLFMALGRFMLALGIVFIFMSVAFFEADESAWVLQDPWESLVSGSW